MHPLFIAIALALTFFAIIINYNNGGLFAPLFWRLYCAPLMVLCAGRAHKLRHEPDPIKSILYGAAAGILLVILSYTDGVDSLRQLYS